MDIRNWPIDQILQLPDHLLSRRYIVSTSLYLEAVQTSWDISELAFPDRAIIHELEIHCAGGFGQTGILRVAIGDQLPTTTAMMDRLEPLFNGLGLQGPGPRSFRMSNIQAIALRRLRMFVPAQGRRLVLELTTPTGAVVEASVNVVVSAVPSEVPDCLLSV